MTASPLLRLFTRREHLRLLACLSSASGLGLEAPAWALPPSPATQGIRPRPLAFPADFGAHPDTRTEWWYITGWLAAPSVTAITTTTAAVPPTPSHGFQLTFFRSRTDLTAAHSGSASASAFAPRQLVFAHLAITDLRDRHAPRQHHDQRLARQGFGRAESTQGDTQVNLGDWQLQRQGDPARSRYTAHWHSSALGPSSGTWALTLETTQPVLLQGEAGYSRKGPHAAQASHYYSQPQLRVQAQWQPGSTTGTPAPAPQTLHGTAWLDHEWSEALLDPQAVGWDWLGMNLLDGSALTVFRLRRADGSTLWAGGSWRRASETAPRVFAPHEVTMQPLRHWRSPRTQAQYPVAWRISTPSGTWQVQTLLDDQELDSRGSTGTVYWEGLSELQDSTGQRVGLGYLELTGYAGRLAL